MPDGFRIASAFVQVSPDMEGFKEELKAQLDEAVAGVEAKARVTLDTSELDAKAEQARATVDELDSTRAEPSIHLNDEGLSARADEARATLDELDSKSARPDIGLDSAGLQEQVDRAHEQLDQLNEDRAEPQVGLDTAEFDAKVNETRAKLAALSAESANLTVDSDGRLRDSRGRFASPGGGGVPGEGGGGGGAPREPGGGSSGSEGFDFSGLSDFTSSLGERLMTLAKVTAVLPSIAPAAAVLGVGGVTGALGLSGIATALSAAHQASTNVGLTPQELAATNFGNQVQNQQAQDQVSQARMQSAQDAITSANSIEQSQMNLASVQRNAAEQQVQALQSVQQAQQGVEEADYSLSEAQYNLSQAWEAARENLRQLDDQLADSKLNVEQAELAIQQAEYQQRLTDQNAYSTSIDRQQAALAVAQAQQQLTDAQDQQTASAYAANLAHQQGVAGSQTVIQAQQAVTAAQYGQVDAHASLSQAQSQATITQLNNADQVKQAQMQLAAASEQASYQQQMDARNVALAERNVTDTLKQQQLQMAATMSTSNQAALEFQKDMARLTPAAQHVVEQILGMKGAFKELQAAAENALAPGLSALIGGLGKAMPGLTDGVTKVGKAISSAFGDLGKALGDKNVQNALSHLLDNGLKLAEVVVPALGGLVGALIDLGSQAGATDGLAKALGAIGDGLSAFVSSLSPYLGAINGVLQPLGEAVGAIGPVLGPLVGMLAKSLAPILATLLPPFERLLDALGKALAPILQAIGPLFQPIAEAVGDVADAFDPLLPVIGSLIGQLAQALAPLLQALVPVIKDLADILSKALQDGLNQVLSAILPLFPPLGQLLASLMPIVDIVLKFAGVLIDLVAKITGPVTEAVGWIIARFADLLAHWQVVVTGIADGATWLYQKAILPLWHGIDDVFQWIESGADWVWHHVFDPFWQGISDGASAFIKDFQTAWNKLEKIFKDPVNFMITTVYTKGIEELWNSVVAAIGQDSLKLPDITPFASGGVVPGYAPGQDTIPAMLSPGEGVLVPEAVRAMGPGTVLALNAAYGGGRVSTPGHYSGGGVIGDIVNDVSGGISKTWDIAKIVAAITTGNTTALNNALTKLVGTNAVGNYAKLMLGVPTTLIGDAVQAVGSLFGGGSSGGSNGGLSAPGPISGTVAQWFAAAVQATGVPTSWIPDLETIGMHESSNNPNAINNWDSNAAAGDPSRGIMQTIMSTFLAYHQAGTSNNIYDPVANISAAINYIKSRYHDVSNVPGIKSMASGGPYVGYDSGGWLMPSGMPVNGLGRPEAVLTPDESQAFVAIVRQLTQQGTGGVGPKGVIVNFNGTQYPTAEQMAAIKREMALALG